MWLVSHAKFSNARGATDGPELNELPLAAERWKDDRLDKVMHREKMSCSA
jgi:hypothetical protein